jgi:hypothetical protein
MDRFNEMSQTEQVELFNILSEEGRDFVRFYLLPNKMVAKYDSDKYENIKDVRNSLNMAFTFLVNEIIEAMTLIDFQKAGLHLEYNSAATRNNSKASANSFSDYVLFYNQEVIFVELQTYLNKSDKYEIKQTKHKSLMNKVLDGYKVYLLNKYMTSEGVKYTYINYNKVVDEDLYSYDLENTTKFGGKVAVIIESPEVEIEDISKLRF